MNSQINLILTNLVSELKGISGIDAIVLGGSRATGTATESSDIDIGIYYNESFDLEAFRSAASILDSLHRTDCITNLGDWGPWINGGGWLTIDTIPVDILLRSSSKVEDCIEDCVSGKITIDYQCGHPFGFINSIYMGELYHCEVLHANSDRIGDMKQRLKEFPTGYKQAVKDKFLWECDFSLMCSKKAAAKEDILSAAGSLYRCANSLIQVLYAVNEMYCINEKGSLERLQKQASIFLPIDFKKMLLRSLSLCCTDSVAAFELMSELYQKVLEASTEF